MSKNNFGSERKITRREFLEQLLKLITIPIIHSSNIFQTIEAQEKIFERKFSIANYEILKSKYEKIKYPKSFEKINEDIKKLIIEIVNFQNQILTKIKKSQNNKNQEKLQEIEKEIQSIKKYFWKKMKEYFPNLEEYSEEKYQHFLSYFLPRYLASYGIFVNPIDFLIKTYNNDSIIHNETFVYFFEISNIETREIKISNKNISVDIVYLKKPLEINGENVNRIEIPNLPSFEAQTFFQNIFIYEELVNKTYLNQRKILLEIKNRLLNFNREKIELSLINTPPKEQKRVALNGLYLLLLKELEIDLEELKQIRIFHELGHFVNMTNEDFKKRFKPQKYDKASELMKSSINFSTHQEIEAFLYQL